MPAWESGSAEGGRGGEILSAAQPFQGATTSSLESDMAVGLALLTASLLTASPAKKAPPPEVGESRPRQYTTYFYTAGEAVVHGYEPDTSVRVISLEKPGTVWQGKVGVGETQTVRTGPGVFGFLSDKKAAILVGTPSSCAVVGYFLKDQEGQYRSHRFFTQLPSAASQGDERFVVWAYEAAHVQIFDRRTEKLLKEGALKAGGFLELSGAELVGNRVLDVRSTGSAVSAQVYYDEGFIVPASTGRGSGREFLAYVGAITNGVNDLNVIAQIATAKVVVEDLKTGEVLFRGPVEQGAIHSLTLSKRYVRVTSDLPVNVVVAGFKHYQDGYAEHHFGTGLEGGGIDNDFLVTTSGELWLFSYFNQNVVTVTDARSGKAVFSGTLGAGAVRGLTPGFGLYRVRASFGASVMGGASSCGADYSPAGGLFAVDEAVFDVVAQIQAERLQEAKARGETLSDDARYAPVTASEWKKYAPSANAKAKKSLSLDEVNQRAAEMQR